MATFSFHFLSFHMLSRALPVHPTQVRTIQSEMLVPASALGGVGWDQIGGLDEAKELLKEAVVLPMLIPNYFTGAAPVCQCTTASPVDVLRLLARPPPARTLLHRWRHHPYPGTYRLKAQRHKKPFLLLFVGLRSACSEAEAGLWVAERLPQKSSLHTCKKERKKEKEVLFRVPRRCSPQSRPHSPPHRHPRAMARCASLRAPRNWQDAPRKGGGSAGPLHILQRVFSVAALQVLGCVSRESLISPPTAYTTTSTLHSCPHLRLPPLPGESEKLACTLFALTRHHPPIAYFFAHDYPLGKQAHTLTLCPAAPNPRPPRPPPCQARARSWLAPSSLWPVTTPPPFSSSMKLTRYSLRAAQRANTRPRAD
jgi:hypothetical protein